MAQATLRIKLICCKQKDNISRRRHMGFGKTVYSLVIISALSGCVPALDRGSHSTISSVQVTQPISENQPQVSVNLQSLQRMALPAGAVLTVTLSDVAVTDGSARVIAQQVMRTEGRQVPFNLTLSYHPQDVLPASKLIVSAVVSVNGRNWLVTDKFKEVVTHQQGNQAELQLVPVPVSQQITQPSL
jgi:putative lipoprotein